MNDAGSIVLGWLTKLIVTLAIIGLIAFDGIAVVTATFTAADHANNDASVAAENYAATKNLQTACDTAGALALKDAERVDNCRVLPNGHFTLTVHRTATTLWMHRFSFLRKYTKVTGDGEGAPSS